MNPVDNFWLGFIKQAYLEKRPYKALEIGKLDPSKEHEAWTAKIEGAHTIVDLKAGKLPRLFSHRISKRTGNPIEYTPKLPHITEKSRLTATLRGETFAVDKDGRPVHGDVVTALLVSKTDRSHELQKELGIRTQTALIDVDKVNGKDVSHMPFTFKRKLMEQIVKANPNFILPDMATTTAQKKSLLKSILSKKHSQTMEGVVTHDLHAESKAFGKAKVIQDHDVYVRRIFTEEGTKPGRKAMAGGIEYSWEPGGEPVGRIGTGFDHATKEDMLKNPQKYIGRAVKANALDLSKNKVLVKPSFIGWHVEKNIGDEPQMAKQTVIISKNIANDREAAKAIAKQFADRLYTARETGQSYRFRQKPPEYFDPKSYKTFKPREGVAIVYGRLLGSKK